ncbi:MAG: phenylacetate-CoA oxygenase subunit PaaI [Candidatus Marinimicrobia bacterium]|nr:phenylacetate-CoA oxygenase subunit PaaI [Candidatus Neomarinimicrobiota bacterium]
MAEKVKETLPKGTEDEFKLLLLAISDTKLLLGYHFGEWTFRTPSLESGIATCNFAQDELGHVRLFHGLLKNHSNETDATLIHERQAENYNSISCLNSSISSWLELITFSAVIDGGVTILLESMSDSSFRPLRERVEKILQEEKFHSDYTDAWVVALANDGNGSSEMVGDVFKKAVPVFASWLNKLNASNLIEAGVLKTSLEETLGNSFTKFEALIKKAGLDLPDPGEMASDDSSDFLQFPQEEIIYSLRGEKNEVFRV